MVWYVFSTLCAVLLWFLSCVLFLNDKILIYCVWFDMMFSVPYVSFCYDFYRMCYFWLMRSLFTVFHLFWYVFSTLCAILLWFLPYVLFLNKIFIYCISFDLICFQYLKCHFVMIKYLCTVFNFMSSFFSLPQSCSSTMSLWNPRQTNGLTFIIRYAVILSAYCIVCFYVILSFFMIQTYT